MSYHVFTRTWWKPNPTWPNGREPQMGPKTILKEHATHTEAREICKEWNRTHPEGAMGRRAEFERN